MDTHRRTWVKAICWQLIGLADMTLVGVLMTGSLALGGSLALANAAVGLAAYVVYERFWGRVSWGRVAQKISAGQHE